MTAADNYAKVYQSVFTEILPAISSDSTNNCIGALNNSTYKDFTDNFINRLNRLRDYFIKHALPLDELKRTARELALKKGYKWSGPYSELIALDYWSRYEEVTDLKFVVNGNVDSFHDSIAKHIGQQTVDLDLSFALPLSTIYMDVKSFIPTHLELIDKIVENVEKEIGIGKCLIGIDELDRGKYLDLRSDLQNNLGKLAKALIEGFNSKKEFVSYTSSGNRQYQFRIAYPDKSGRTTLATINWYEPYKDAFDLSYKPLEYYNKLLITEASMICFVRNPWFDSEMNSILGNSSEIFYRALSRRVFIELTQNEATFDASLTCKEISEKITGLLFIEDNSIKAVNDADLYRSYIYLNPRCTNKKLNRKHFGVLNQSAHAAAPMVVDDFQYDNY